MAPHDPSRRRAILDAATASFSRYGFRKTTMDQVAHDAGVAKPTLYAWFENKDALFYAVCDALMTKILNDAELARAIADPLARIRGILEAKFTTVFELVASSPHAQELLTTRNEALTARLDAADRDFRAVLVQALTDAERDDALDLRHLGGPVAAAKVLMLAGHGAGYAAASRADHTANVAALTIALLGPARPTR